MLRTPCPTPRRQSRSLLTGLLAVALATLSGTSLQATNPPPPTAPAFHLSQPLPGLGTATGKIVASSVMPAVDDAGKHLDKRRPISFAGNGTQDVAIADGDQNQILIKQGNAAGTAFTSFSVVVSADNLGTLTDFAVGDVNGDGLPDLVVCAAGSVEVLINTSNTSSHVISFADPVVYQAVDHANADAPINLVSVALVSVGSAEGAGGALDIVAGATLTRNDDPNHPYGYLCRFTNLSNAAGAFDTTPAVYNLQLSADRIAVGDLNNDGYVDIVVGDTIAQRFSVIKNIASGAQRTIDPSVSTPVDYFNPDFFNFAVGDIDADGGRDIVLLTGHLSVDPDNGNTATSGIALWHNKNNGTGALDNYHSLTLKPNIPTGGGVIAGSVAIGDLNSDGTVSEVALADSLDEKVSIVTFDPFLQGLNHSISSVTAKVTTVTAGAQARAVDIGDINKDFGMDLVVANSENTTPGNYFLNTVAGTDDGGGVVDLIPDGKGVSFGSVIGSAVEGSDFTVNVLRGKDSTGQVAEYVHFSGNAIPLVNGNKDADYSVVNPAPGSPIVFPDTTGPEAHLQKIKIHTIKNTVKEAAKALFIDIQPPIGDAIIGQPDAISIGLLDGTPLLQAAPGALAVTPASVVKKTAAELKALGVKQVGRTNSLFNFSVTQAFPKGATNPKVKVQYTTVAAPVEADWLFAADLTAKGNVWSGNTQTLPVASKLYFRSLATVDGYPDKPGKTTLAYQVVGGPLLQLSAGVNTSYTPGFFNQSAVPVPSTPEDMITYRFAYKNAQITNGDSAHHVLLTAKIPTHTTYVSGTVPDQTVTAKIITVKGVKMIQWDLGTLDQTTDQLGTKFVEVKVLVDQATTFDKTKNPLKAYGVVIAEDQFSLTSDETAPVNGPPTSLNAVLHGPIELAISRPSGQSTVQGGDLIDYQLLASNTSGTTLTTGTVRARIPAGTVLSQVYFPDNLGNSTVNVLPNPSAITNPAVVYIVLKTSKLLNFKFTKGAKVDPTPLGETLVKSLIDQGYIAQEIEWTIPPIAPHSQVTLNYQVRVIYDLGQGTGVQQKIVNDDYDFTIGTGTSLVSALYGQDPDPGPVTSTFDPSEPTNLPELRLKKSADGGLALSNPAFHGNGQQYIAGIGDVVTCIPANGLDYLLTYRNKGLASAHNVVIHDVIPVGLELRGFFENTTDGQKLPPGSNPTMFANQFTFYDVNGLAIPAVDPESNQNNMAKVRSMDIRLGALQNYDTLPANTTGVIRYTCQPIIKPTTVTTYPDGSKTGPGEIHSFGGYLADQGVNGKLQGFFITSTDLKTPADGAPDDLVVRVVGDISWGQPQYARSFAKAIPGSIFHFDIPFAQNGDVSAPGSHVDFTVPQGVTFLNNGTYYPGFFFTPPSSPTDLGIQLTNLKQTTVTGGTRVVAGLGEMPAHASGLVRIWFMMNTPYDPVLRASGGCIFPKDIAFGPTTLAQAAGVRTLNTSLSLTHATATSTVAAGPTQAGTGGNPTIASEASAPHLTLQRTAPYTVPKNGTFTYVVNFANTGQTAATNVTIGMQIPFFTHSRTPDTADNGYLALPGAPDVNGPRSVITPNPEKYKYTVRTNATVIKQSGAGYDKVFWHFASVPANTTGRVTLTVVVSPGFADQAITDHSLYISADNAPSVVISPNPLSTWVLGDKKFQDVKALILARFCAEMGMTLDAKVESVLSKYEDALGPDSRVKSTSALDELKIGSISIAPVGNDQVIVSAPASIISHDGGGLITVAGGAVISNDGAGLVATGLASAITLHADGLANMTADAALDNALQLIANKQAGLVAAGGGNLIGQDGAGFSILSNHPGGGSALIGSNLTGLVAAGGGNIISDNSAGLIAGVGALISNDGAGVISNDGAGLISNDGAGLISNDGGGFLEVHSVGNNFSNNGTSLVGSDVAKSLGPNGAALKQ